MSTSTSLRTLAGSESDSANGPQTTPGEPASLDLQGRQRAALRELLHLVAERAEAEEEANQSRSSNQTKVETEYSKTRQGLVEKFQTLDREARTEDEQRRRAIIDKGMMGEAKAKADFAASSRRIASEFDTFRETAKNQYNRARSDASKQLEAGNRKAATDHTDALKPLGEAVNIAEGFRDRLAALAADYGKFKLATEPPAPSRESYDKFTEPVNELFDRLAHMEPALKILEGLIIPKSMKGTREAWTFLVPFLICVGIAIALGLPAAGIGGLAVTGLAIGGLLRTWLAQVSKTQLQRLHGPLFQSLADANGLAAYCQAQADSRYADERKRVTAQHEDAMKRQGKPRPGHRDRGSPAR